MTVKRAGKEMAQSDLVVEFILIRELEELENLSVEHVARSLKISRAQLWRTFKNEKQMTPEEYIFRIKLTQAAALLQYRTELSVKHISESIGYYCYDYFIRIFKQYFGTTPGRYRELKRRQ